MENRGRLGSAGKDEALERSKPRVDQVAELLEPYHLFGADPKPLTLVVGGNRKVGAEIEQLVLNLLEPGSKLVGDSGGEEDSDERVQLVNRSEGFDPKIRFRDACSVAEARLPCVARARVDACQPNGLVAPAGHAGVGTARSPRPRIERAITRRWISLVPS